MWIWILSAIFLSFPLSACSHKDSPENPAATRTQQTVSESAAPPAHGDALDPETRLIVALGDSLTSGLGIRQEETYPSLLQRRLDRLGFSYRVVNAGVTADTTAGGLRRVQGIIRLKPDMVLLELGANDGLRGLPLNVIEHNLKSIIDPLRAEGIQVVLLGMRLPPNYGQDYTSGFQQVYGRLAKKYRLPFVPFFLEGVAAKPELNQEDGIHPTAAGYKIVEENLWPVLKPLLRS
ncbi:MAG: arylesterase [Nitrospirae bacterium]|nr:arylesterase [Nitrospirota bacterium]